MLPALVQHVGQLFDKAMSSCSTADTNVSAAVETVLLSRLHERVFGVVSMAFAAEDACVNKRAKNVEVEVADSLTSLEEALGVEERLRPSLEEAGEELSRLPGLRSPMEKMRCFEAAIGLISGGCKVGSTDPLSSDDILPAVIFLLLSSWSPGPGVIPDLTHRRLSDQKLSVYPPSPSSLARRPLIGQP